MNVVTITGIRPDFIRMSEIFKKLDKNFKHTLIHTGQHYDKMLSEIFFHELDIRKPDYQLTMGGANKEHFHQLSYLSTAIIELFRSENIKPDIVLFLGDSNSVCAALPLKKEGYRIGHIEAGMRSGDKRMLEEINRITCDHCSDILFTYHNNYTTNLIRENISSCNIYNVGNNIVEPCKKIIDKYLIEPVTCDYILVDIHRPENFLYKNRLVKIIEFVKEASYKFKVPIKMVRFKRTFECIEKYNIDMSGIDVYGLMSYVNFIKAQYNSLFIISDSGTAQEEPALLNTPVLVPRDYTERPESIEHNCSKMVDVFNDTNKYMSLQWISSQLNVSRIDSSWLGNGCTSDLIVERLKR